MNEIERKKLQSSVLEIADRVQTNGRDGEIVHIKIDILLKGQPAINYKVLRLFAPSVPDAELSRHVFLLGLQNSANLLKILASKRGISV